jgi:hypothetical protein
VHLFDLFPALGFSSLQDDDGAEKAFANLPLTMDELGATGVKFLQLAFALLQLLLLALKEKEFLLSLLELLSDIFHGSTGTDRQAWLVVG